jgi:hypothetical protein
MTSRNQRRCTATRTPQDKTPRRPIGRRIAPRSAPAQTVSPKGDGREPINEVDFLEVQGGLPHSEIHGSKLIRSSPWLIAAYHVLHRLCMPRHPPDALISLDHSHRQCSPFQIAFTPTISVMVVCTGRGSRTIRRPVGLRIPCPETGSVSVSRSSAQWRLATGRERCSLRCISFHDKAFALPFEHRKHGEMCNPFHVLQRCSRVSPFWRKD